MYVNSPGGSVTAGNIETGNHISDYLFCWKLGRALSFNY